MKYFALLLAAGLAMAAVAQVPPASPNDAAVPAPAPAEQPNWIPNTNGITDLLRQMSSDMADIDPKNRKAIFTGNVRVDEPRMKLACELLTARLPEGGGRPDHIIAETNVVIDALDDDGKPVHALADRAEYTWTVTDNVTNEVITLVGNPVRYNAKGTPGTGTNVIWNKTTGSLRIMGFKAVGLPTESLRTNVPRSSNTATN